MVIKINTPTKHENKNVYFLVIHILIQCIYFGIQSTYFHDSIFAKFIEKIFIAFILYICYVIGKKENLVYLTTVFSIIENSIVFCIIILLPQKKGFKCALLVIVNH